MGGRQSKQGEGMMGGEARCRESLSEKEKPVGRGGDKSNRLEEGESAWQCRFFAPTLCPRLSSVLESQVVVDFEVKEVDVRRV